MTYRTLGSEDLDSSLIGWRSLTFPCPKVFEHAPETIIRPSNVQARIKKLWWGRRAPTCIATLGVGSIPRIIGRAFCTCIFYGWSRDRLRGFGLFATKRESSTRGA